MKQLTLPSLGEGIEKGTVISISVKEGDAIEAEQTFMEVETDKVVVEVPADASGTVNKVLVAVGDEISEGDAILLLAGGEAVSVVEENEPIAHEPVVESDVLVAPAPLVATTAKTKTATSSLVELKLPSLGEGIDSGTIIALHVGEGETVAKEQILMEVETDKVVVEVPSDADGTVKKVLVNIGDAIAEGTIFLQLETSDASITEIAVANESVKEIEAKPEVKQEVVIKEEEKTLPKPEPAVKVTPPRSGKTFRSSPLARKLARELGVDITEVTPQGNGNRIGVQDVKAFVKTRNESDQQATVTGAVKAIAPLPDFSKWGSIHKKPLAGITQATSKNMTTTWSEIPHAWLQEKIDITDLEAKRQVHKHQVKAHGGSLTITSILVKVMAKALEKFPIFNTSFDAQSNEIIFKEYINIGVAVDSERGLLVPVLRDADQKGLLEISQDLVSLSQSVKDKKTKPEDLQGGTFTISNLGGIGTSAIFPLVNHPQAAILGVAASTKEAVWKDGAFEPRLMMPLTIGFDHRIINGADAARFLQYTKQLLEDWFLWNI